MQRFPFVALAALTLAACDGRTPTDAAVAVPNGVAAQRAAVVPAAPTVIVSGLEYPRGFTFGRDGAIYVAEAGTPLGNDFSTTGQCQQVPSPVGPSKGGHTGRISRVTMAGVRTTVVAGLPSSRNGNGAVSGVADVAFVNHGGSKENDDEDDDADGGGTTAQGASLYALVLGGCSHGLPDEPSRVLRVGLNGTYAVVADLSRWIKANPTKNPEADDFEPDGDWYNLAARGNLLYAVEANQGNLVSIKQKN